MQTELSVWAVGDYAAVGAKIHAMAEDLVQAADLPGTARVLDIATGTGNAAIAAARCGCRVTGVDTVPDLLERARARTAAEGFTIEYMEGDAEDLPFPDGSYDAVVSVVGVMFAADQKRAAAELLRVCRPGGRIALANWSPDGMIGEMFALVAGYAPAPPGGDSPLRWGTDDGLRELLGDSVAAIRTERREFVLRAPSFEAYADLMLTKFGPVYRTAQALDASGRVRLREDLLDLFRRYNRGDVAMASPGAYLRAFVVR